MQPPAPPVNLLTLARHGDPVRTGDPVRGSPDECSDWARWHNPNVRSAQYCTALRDILWQRASRTAQLGGVISQFLAPNRGPVLVGLTQSAQHPYDVPAQAGSPI